MKTISMVDVETTGLDAQKHEIIEVGLVEFEDQAPFKIIRTLDLKVKPEHPETGEAKAFEVNGYTEEEWKDAESLVEVLHQVGEVDHRSTLMSYNISFDWAFLEAAYKKAKMRSLFDYHRLDLFTIAWMGIPHEEIANWKLKTVCEKLGIAPEPDIHRALNGAMAGYDVYRSLCEKQTLLSL